MPATKRARGRPPKFDEPSSVITVTLPRSTLEALERIDPDRARAIVKATARASSAQGDVPNVELVEVGPQQAIMLVSHPSALLDIEGVQLIEIVPSRYMILLSPGVPLSTVEVLLQDKLETMKPSPAKDRAVITQVLQQLRSSRRNQQIETREVILLNLGGES